MTRPPALAVALVAVAVLAAGCGHKGNKVSSRKRTTTSSSGSSSSSSSSTGSNSSSSSPSSPPTAATAGRPAGATATTAVPHATSPTSPPAPGASNGRFTKLATLDQPVAAVPVGSALYVAQKTGKVVVLRNGQVAGTVLDISNQVSTGSEQGLLGIAVAGNHLYVDFTDKNAVGNTNVIEYTLNGDQAASPRTLLTETQPYANHNGGQVVFGPDEKLYIGLGDGGSADDPNGNGQNLGTWLGKILRIDPTPSAGQPYTVPGDNPFVGRSGAKPEIWAYGLRNPWRFTFDRANGDLWIGDVGQNAWEEVDHVAAGRAGVNYEWDLQEGSHSHQGGSKPANGVGPVYEYGHGGGNCSITGGYLYRGSRIPGLVGSYVFADFCVGKVLALSGSGVRDLGPVVTNLSSFAEDAAGELYALSLSGGVYRIDPV